MMFAGSVGKTSRGAVPAKRLMTAKVLNMAQARRDTVRDIANDASWADVADVLHRRRLKNAIAALVEAR